MGKSSREKQKRREDNLVCRQTSRLERISVFIITLGTYLILFTPLIVVRSSFFPFVTPKTIYFRILVEIISAAYLILVISFPRYRPKLNLLSISIFIFFGISVLASVFGINFERSFWSTYERMTGIFTLSHLLIFFLILSSVFKERKDWEKLLTASILAGVLLSLYVLLSPQQISTRGGGTIGNTSFMATYLLFDIFFAVALFLSKKDFSWRFFSGGSLAIMLPVLFTSSARGAVIFFWAGLFLLFLGYLIYSGKNNLKRLGLFLIFSLMVLMSVSAIFQPFFVKNKVETIMREMQPRFAVWETGWKGFLERPVLGWGPENFNVVFTKFFNPCMFLGECGGEIWFDRSHNIVLDTLVAAGIVGFLSYLLIFAVSISGLLRSAKQQENIFFSLGMAILLVVYFFQNLLVFDMISSYMVFFFSLGFINFLLKKEQNQPLLTAPKRTPPFLAGLILISTIVLLYFGNVQPAFSAVNTVKMIISSTGLAEAADIYKMALKTMMEKYEMREQFALRVYQAGFSGQTDTAGKEVLTNAFEFAEKQMEQSVKENYLDFRPRLFLGKVYFGDYYFTGQKEKLDLAEKVFEKSIELSPRNQQGYWHLAEVVLSKGENQRSIDLLQKAADLEPRVDRSHWYLAMFYKATGKYQQALEEMKKAKENGYDWNGNLDDLKKAIEIYQELKDDSNLIPLYQKAIEFQPKNTQFWANLAASFANVGEFEAARETAKKLAEIDPSFASKVEEFLNSLPQP